MKSTRDVKNPVKISAKSVFEVHNSRLGIGVFNRPLLDHEARTFKRAWETEAFPGFEDFELSKKRVCFVSPPDRVADGWSAIDRMLARLTQPVKKAS